MGSGKTTVGKALAELKQQPLIDLDQLIEQQEKKPITAIFKDDGEAYFRQVEHDALIQTFEYEGIVSTGGGVIERADNRAWLTDKQVVFLETPWSMIVERLKHDKTRPLWQQGLAEKEHLFNRRQPFYEEVSRCVIDTRISTPTELAKRIMTQLGR
ncbi:shikimate kinase [Halolactibacillus halophilus]|nr:shikimate kinase [Halolactibacillus halophilus]